MLKVMMYLEICCGKEDMKNSDYQLELGGTTAATCRIAEGVDKSSDDGIPETIKGDAWFGSIKTACELAKRGENSVLQVKVAKRLYPKAEIESIMKDKPRGTHVTLKGTHPETGTKLVALGYKYNSKTVMCFVFTEDAGSTTPGRPYEMKFSDDHSNICIRLVDRPEVVSTFYDEVNIIDVLNHLCQSCLALEKSGLHNLATSIFILHLWASM
jgi:hypothetical protein